MLTLEKAQEMIRVAHDKASELGVAVTAVVVDDHGTIIAVGKMDGAIPISPSIAYAKAFTAASLGVPSEGLAKYAGEGKPYFGVNTLLGGELTPIAGGMPVKMGEKLVGGVGVGGSMDVSQDADCAEAAAKISA